MLRGIRLNLSRNAVEALLKERSQRPAGAVARKHVEVVNVHVRLAVRAAHFRRIDVVEPVVGNYLPGNIQNETAQRIALVGIGVDAPVELIEILVDGALHIDPALFGVARLGAGFAINDVGAQRRKVPGFKERMLDGILHPLDIGGAGCIMLGKTGKHMLLNHAPCFLLIEFVGRTPGLSHSQHDFFRIEIPDGPVALEEMLREGARHTSFPDKSREYKNYNL